MITAAAFAGKHYAVLGLARSGLATVEALLASGAKVTAWDSDAEARAKAPAGTVLADLDNTDLSQFDSLVVSPGVPLNRHPIAARAREAGVEIIGDIELFARARAELPTHKVVGITGTNGKSTTTALIHHILQTAGVPSLMGGNIGLPILAQDPLPEGGVYVLELSSYQIDLTRSLDCDVAVLLNITPDHLDRYESFEAYAASKARLFETQSAGHPAFFDCVDPIARAVGDQIEILRGTADVYFQDNDDLWTVENGMPDWPALKGLHNASNALAAMNVAIQLGIDEDTIERGLRTFRGLPHRMELVRVHRGARFINDSKATNTEAAAPALSAYPIVRWIVGGQAKAETLGDTALHLDHVAAAYTIGEAGPMFARLLRDAGVTVIECETLENATKCAAEDSQAGETVLLSPASASFDQFRDFEERGDRFRDLVGAL